MIIVRKNEYLSTSNDYRAPVQKVELQKVELQKVERQKVERS